MRDFVREDRGELRFVARRLHRAAMDPDGPARERERVELAVIGDGEAVGIPRTAGARREAPPDRGNIRGHLAIRQRRNRPPHFALRLAADADLVIDGNDRQLRRGAARQQQAGGRRQQDQTLGVGAAGISSGRWRRSRA